MSTANDRVARPLLRGVRDKVIDIERPRKIHDAKDRHEQDADRKDELQHRVASILFDNSPEPSHVASQDRVLVAAAHLAGTGQRDG